MNWKTILGVVLGVVVVLGIVALYNPSSQDDTVTGAFSFKDIFSRGQSFEKKQAQGLSNAMGLLDEKDTLIDNTQGVTMYNSKSHCNNIDGDSDYDGVADNDDNCPSTPFAMTLLTLEFSEPFDSTQWLSARIVLRDIGMNQEGNPLAELIIKNIDTGEMKYAGVSVDKPLALGGIFPELEGSVYLKDYRITKDLSGKVTEGNVVLLVTKSINIKTGC